VKTPKEPKGHVACNSIAVQLSVTANVVKQGQMEGTLHLPRLPWTLGPCLRQEGPLSFSHRHPHSPSCIRRPARLYSPFTPDTRHPARA
jgi:hypothetical protein